MLVQGRCVVALAVATAVAVAVAAGGLERGASVSVSGPPFLQLAKLEG
jgi:hypothetical protein